MITHRLGVFKLGEVVDGCDAPVGLRKFLLSDDKLKRVVDKAVPTIVESLKTEIDDAAMERIRTGITAVQNR